MSWFVIFLLQPTDRSGKNVYALLTAIHEQYQDCRLMER